MGSSFTGNGSPPGPDMAKVISVCDRESDVIEYLTYKVTNQHRFVLRSMQDRRLEESEETLYTFNGALQSAGERRVHVAQRGARKAREAICEIRYAPVTVKMPVKKPGESVALYYVSCQEINHDKALCWHLLTSEPVHNQEEAKRVLDYYEKRWLIEEFHKAWKSGGTQVEGLRMQSKDNLEKMVVILAFIAVRVHQLRYLGLNRKEAEQQSCETLLSPLAWKLLWSKQAKTKPPKTAPSIYWAYISLGKLAGWNDSKRNGRVGWERLWEGWFMLQTLTEGYLLAKSLDL
ncbi:transposase (fragment) [Xenorhabdus nematophila str. Anatoliense]